MQQQTTWWKRKTGPLPMWAWIIIVVIIAGLAVNYAQTGNPLVSKDMQQQSANATMTASAPTRIPAVAAATQPPVAANSPAPASNSNGNGHVITYMVKGTVTSASVSYINEQNGTQQEDISVPWSKSFNFPTSGFSTFYIAAQSKQGSGSITCEVWEDGKQVKTSTSSGSFVIASCTGNP